MKTAKCHLCGREIETEYNSQRGDVVKWHPKFANKPMGPSCPGSGRTANKEALNAR